MAAAEGRWARHGRQLETAAFGCETAGAVRCSPRQGALQMKPATSRCRVFRTGFHPRAVAGAAVGGGPRHGRQLETAAFGGAKPPGAVRCSPRQGALQMKPATSSCRAFCAVSTHGRWPRPKGVGPRYGRPLKTAAFVGRNRLWRLIAAPARGLCKRSPQLPVAGRNCPGFQPRAAGAAGGDDPFYWVVLDASTISRVTRSPLAMQSGIPTPRYALPTRYNPPNARVRSSMRRIRSRWPTVY